MKSIYYVFYSLRNYNDLQKNWSDDHAEKFINGMTKVVFKKLGIK